LPAAVMPARPGPVRRGRRGASRSARRRRTGSRTSGAKQSHYGQPVQASGQVRQVRGATACPQRLRVPPPRTIEPVAPRVGSCRGRRRRAAGPRLGNVRAVGEYRKFGMRVYATSVRHSAPPPPGPVPRRDGLTAAGCTLPASRPSPTPILRRPSKPGQAKHLDSRSPIGNDPEGTR
jgi:hypothetical protein